MPNDEVVRAWLREQTGADCAVSFLPGDVSPRRYAQVTAGDASWILAYYPESIREAFGRYLETTRVLQRCGVRVANVLGHDRALGLMLLDDLGRRTVYELRCRGWPVVMAWLDDAAAQAARWRELDRATVDAINPPLGRALMVRELAQTWELLLERELAHDRGLAAALAGFLEQVVERLAAGPQEVCHRDLMARNLVPVEAAESAAVAVVDHQDLRLGPAGYDLASLWNDSLYPPAAWLERSGARWLEVERDQLGRCVVQRTFKIVGTFLRFAALGSPRHLKLVAPTLRRSLSAMAGLREPDGRALARALRQPLRDSWSRL